SARSTSVTVSAMLRARSRHLVGNCHWVGQFMEQWERLLDELREEFILREEELKLLHEVDMQLLQSEHPQTGTFEFIVRRTQELLKSNLTVVFLRRGRRLEAAYSTDERLLGQRLPLSVSMPWQSLVAADIVNIEDVDDPQFAGNYRPIEGYAGPR